jgi:hypothetical protein
MSRFAAFADSILSLIFVAFWLCAIAFISALAVGIRAAQTVG